MKSLIEDRETVGTQYIEAQKSDMRGYTTGDFANPMVSGFIEDLNNAIMSNPYEGRPFYINVVETRDLQMKNAFKRIFYKSLYLPYPEDNTFVVYTDPKKQKTYFCWDLPHHSNIHNIMITSHLYDYEYIERLKEWMRNDLTNFGFIKVKLGDHVVEDYDEKTIQKYKELWIDFLKSHGADEKAIESEKKLGFFWIPNKKFKFKEIANKNPKISLALA